MIGHRLVGCTLLGSGEIGPSWTHFDQAITLYNPAEHHQAAARFAPDITMMSISWRALASWMLGHPEAALPALDRALALAREIGRAVDLKFVLIGTQPTRIQSGDYATARAQLDEGLAWRMKKALRPGRPWGRCSRVAYSPLPASLRRSVSSIVSAIESLPFDRADTVHGLLLVLLARAHAGLGQFAAARRCIGEAVATLQASGTKWLEADVYRISGEIALLSPEHRCRRSGGLFRTRARDRSRATELAPGSFAPRRASRGSGAIRAAAPKPAISSRPSTVIRGDQARRT